MKGLILKDLYVTIHRQKTLLVLPLIFLLVGILDGNNGLMLTYAIVFIGMLPLNLISTDESEKWMEYCGTLPLTKAQYVTSKYVFSILATSAVFAVVSGLDWIWILVSGNTDMPSYAAAVISCFLLGYLLPALQLPFVFRFGADKGRILFMAVYLVIAFSYAYFIENTPLLSWFSGMNVPILIAAVAVIYALSWLLSVRMYQKRTK